MTTEARTDLNKNKSHIYFTVTNDLHICKTLVESWQQHIR